MEKDWANLPSDESLPVLRKNKNTSPFENMASTWPWTLMTIDPNRKYTTTSSHSNKQFIFVKFSLDWHKVY